MRSISTIGWSDIARVLGVHRDTAQRRWRAEKGNGPLSRIIGFGGPDRAKPVAVTDDLEKLRDAWGGESHEAITNRTQLARAMGCSAEHLRDWLAADRSLSRLVREISPHVIEVDAEEMRRAIRKLPRKPRRRRGA
ncbi:MAG: hypothetical protein KC591_05100 [Gemmatimonadetes bacterium]|nr:hypothetical protein [Gemmatimonadota bacterium]